MFAIEEASRRKPEFRGDVEVKLCDGQVWYLPKPRVRLFSRTLESGGIDLKTGSSFGPNYAAKVERYYRSLDDVEQSAEPFVTIMMDLAVSLLRMNYQLSEEDLAGILWFDFGDPEDAENEEMRRIILETALGLRPKKASEIGSGPT